GRRPGDPAWNASRYAVFRLLAKQMDTANAQELDRQMLHVSEEMSKLNPDRSAVAAAASLAVPLAQRIAERLAALPYDQALVLRLLERIPEIGRASCRERGRASVSAVAHDEEE